MIRPLKTTNKYFATTEREAKEKIKIIHEKTDGIVTSQKIDKKEHKDAGDYFEVTVVVSYSTSKDILEGGF